MTRSGELTLVRRRSLLRAAAIESGAYYLSEPRVRPQSSDTDRHREGGDPGHGPEEQNAAEGEDGPLH
jgi:hypothetical protein